MCEELYNLENIYKNYKMSPFTIHFFFNTTIRQLESKEKGWTICVHDPPDENSIDIQKHFTEVLFLYFQF